MQSKSTATAKPRRGTAAIPDRLGAEAAHTDGEASQAATERGRRKLAVKSVFNDLGACGDGIRNGLLDLYIRCLPCLMPLTRIRGSAKRQDSESFAEFGPP